MGKVRNIFAIDVGKYTKNAEDQRSAFAVAKSIWDEVTQRLIAVPKI
jgi:putative transposase